MHSLRASAAPVKPSSFRLAAVTDTGDVYLSAPYEDLGLCESLARLSLLDGDVDRVELYAAPGNVLLQTFWRKGSAA